MRTILNYILSSLFVAIPRNQPTKHMKVSSVPEHKINTCLTDLKLLQIY